MVVIPLTLWLGRVCDLFACCIFESWEPSFVEFQTFLFFVEVLLVLVNFNGFPVQSDVMIADVVQYFSMERYLFWTTVPRILQLEGALTMWVGILGAGAQKK